MKYRSFLGFLTGESQNGFNCPFERSELQAVNTHVVSDEHSVLDSKLYVADVAEFRQRGQMWLCHFGNSFNAEYSTEDTKYLSTTGAEYKINQKINILPYL